MSLFNALFLDKISDNEVAAYRYFPDILPYLHDQREYVRHWQSLVEAKFIYSNGSEVRPASWFRYLFETIKGFLGFINHCQPQRVTIGLMKFAYYGYVHEYNQTWQNPIYNLLPETYVKMVVLPRSSETSEKLQKELISYYLKYDKLFTVNKSAFYPTKAHVFGSSLKEINAYQNIPTIDPQNPELVQLTIENLEANYTKYSFLHGSYYAKQAAVHHVDQSKNSKGFFNYVGTVLRLWEDPVYKHLKRALLFDPQCKISHLETYIDFYCQKNERDLAFALILKLEKVDKAVLYLVKKPFSTDYLKANVDKDSRIGIALAKCYLGLTYKESHVRIASFFASNLNTIHPKNVFRFDVAKKKYDQAYAIITDKKNQALTFNCQAKKILADFYDQQGETSYNKGKTLRRIKAWKNAAKLYLYSLESKKKAMAIQPTNQERIGNYYEHLRLYAQVLIESNQHIDTHLVNQKEVDVAIKYLADCQANIDETDYQEVKLLNKALANAWMLSVDILCTVIAVDDGYDTDSSISKKHNSKHKQSLDLVCQQLRNIINLLKGTTDKKLTAILAKAYYLLGDIIYFFNLTNQKVNPVACHRTACELAPNNPFYLLRYAELMSNASNYRDLQANGIIKLKEAGYTVSRYTDWFDERWNKNKIGYYDIVNIHSALGEIEANQQNNTINAFSI